METRGLSHERIDKNQYYKWILQILSGRQMTAREIAEELHTKGYTPSNERNYAAPRLTEMSQMGYVEPCGKKYCWWTGRLVTVYEAIGG